MKKLFILLSLLSCLLAESKNTPEPKREFRGCWIQCVNGQFEGLSPQEMREKLTNHLNALAKCHINVVMFQVRAEGDALYPSTLEPWSRFLTGRQGVAPQPMWDPLAWMVQQCHQRNMEIHAWINPYRAKTAGTKELDDMHPFRQHPDRFMEYGNLVLFNPGIKENREEICRVVTDIINRYDVDGIHLDDYFYPYPQAGLAIPDEQTFNANKGGYTDIGDWRRRNVNLLMQDLHTTIHNLKPWVKLGVAPFGIYHNESSNDDIPGSETKGLQNYDDLYADVLRWVNEGWVDYCIPQIYWQIGHPTADYEILTRWWAKEASARPVIIGQDVDRTVKYPDVNNKNINQLPAKIKLQRSLPSVKGSCVWYSAALAEDHGNYATALSTLYQTNPALLPLMPFIDDKRPKKVKGLKALWTAEGLMLVWLAPEGKTIMDQPYRYVVYRFAPGEKKDYDDTSHIIAITSKSFIKLPYEDGKVKYKYAVSVLDRMQNESKVKTKSVKL